MSSGAAVPPLQDLSPPNGFPHTIKYKRYLPARGPSGAVMILATIGIMSYGWCMVLDANQENRELLREKAYARIFLAPLLQAETDRDLVRRLDCLKGREAGMMKDRTDWSVLDLKAPVQGIGKGGVRDSAQSEPVYHTKRYVSPTYVYLPQDNKEDTSFSILSPQWWRGSTMSTKNLRYHNRADFTTEYPIGK